MNTDVPAIWYEEQVEGETEVPQTEPVFIFRLLPAFGI